MDFNIDALLSYHYNMNASSSASTADDGIQATLENALQRIDPFIRFLTKATGKASVPFKTLVSVLPNTNNNAADNAALRTTSSSNNDNRNSELKILLTDLSLR